MSRARLWYGLHVATYWLAAWAMRRYVAAAAPRLRADLVSRLRRIKED